MDVAQTPWHVISAAFVFIFGLFVAYAFRKYFHVKASRSWFLYFWHTGFCLVYVFYIRAVGGDSIGYFTAATSGDIVFSLGTRAIEYLTWILVTLFGLSFLGAFLVFNIFGFVGLLAFDASLRAATHHKPRNIRILATIIVLLPSVSFWSSAIGKDSLAFMAAGLALWAALDLKRRLLLMIFAIIVMLFVRPHMAGMLVLALAISYGIQANVSILQRLFFGGLSLLAVGILVPLALDYAGLRGEIDLMAVEAYVEQRQGYNMEGGGGIDISAMSFPMQLFTYMFRPLPFEAHSIPALAASLDNMILLYLFVIGGWGLLVRRSVNPVSNRLFMWAYVLMAWSILAMTTANLGISVRQKWMFAPMLIFLLISVMGSAGKPVRYSSISRRYAAGDSANDLRAG